MVNPTRPYDGWCWPVEMQGGRRPVISDGFKAKATATTRQHLGCDIMFKRAQRGEPKLPGYTAWFDCVDARVLAAYDGHVWAVHKLDEHGISLELDHHSVPLVGPRVTVYRHLATCLVEKGQAVKAGQLIGIAGYDKTKAPTATPNHLHFEVWDTSRPRVTGNPREDYGIDPALVMGAWDYRDGANLWRGSGSVLVAADDALHSGEEPSFAAVAASGAELGLLV